MRHRTATQSTRPTLISLFAGAGGLDLGLESAGFRTLVANDIQPYACETLRCNQLLPTLTEREFDAWFTKQLEQRCYKGMEDATVARLRRRIHPRDGREPFLESAKIVPGDIRGLPTNELLRLAGVKRGELTLVAGGPPCQPFSRSGKRESVEVEDGRLFLEFVRVVDEARPRWFVFENVKGLLLTKTEVAFASCRKCGKEWVPPFEHRDTPERPREPCTCGNKSPGWRTELRAGGSLDIILGEFQRIGYSCTWTVLNAVDFGAPQFRERLIIVGSRDGEQVEWPAPTHDDPGGQTTQPQLGLFGRKPSGKPAWTTMFDTLWRKGHAEFGTLDLDRACLWVKNVVRPHAEPVTWRIDRPSPTVGAHQSAKFALAPEGVPEEQLRRQQWHVLGKRQGDLPPVPVKHAYLSDEELLALQTFPRSWYLYGTRMERAFQIGNAVPVCLGKAVGEAVLAASGLSSSMPSAAAGS